MALWSRLLKTVRGARHRAEIDEELEFHLQMEAADGYDARQARLRLGNPASLREQTRSAGIVEWLDSAVRDARHGVRQMIRTPVLTLAVLLSLALGVGANAAIFSLVNAALLRPLPVADPQALRLVEWTNDGFPPGVSNINGDFSRLSGESRQGSSVSASLHRRLAAEQGAFGALVGIADPNDVALTVEGGVAEQLSLQYVSANFFQGIGAPPAIGRPFMPDDDRVGAGPVVIVSHRFWLSRLGGGDAFSRTVLVNNAPARIVGVAPRGFFGLMAGQWTDVYAPLAARVAFQPPPVGAPRAEDDTDWWVRQVGRLRPGVTEASARSELDRLFGPIAVPAGTAQGKTPRIVTLPGLRGIDSVNARDRNGLWVMMLLVGVLMLLVCANVANLLLARAIGRQRESAARLALGATPGRLFRQHIIESAMIAIVAGGIGLALGIELAHGIHRLFQAGRGASSAFELGLDARVLAYTAALSMLTAFLFGLAPAVRSARADLGEALRMQSRSVMGGGLRLSRVLVAVQIALCFGALVAAGLLGRSLANLKASDVGFDREHVAYATVSPGRAGYTAERRGPYLDRLRDSLSRVPGVLQVSPVQTRPLSGGGNNGRVNIAGRPYDDTSRANMNRVGDGFFDLLRMPVIAGRALDRRDMDGTSGAVVVDDVFARRFFPGENALGRRFGMGQTDNQGSEIVGIVGNSKYNSMRSDAYPTVYEPYRPGGTIHLAIRTTLDGSGLTETIRRTVASIDPAVPLAEFHTQSGLIDRLLRTERLLGVLSGAFGVAAVTLAAIGLAGLLAYAVARRTSEIGVRLALGATARDVVRMVLRDSLTMVAAGIVLGIPLAYAIARLLGTMLFMVKPSDPWTVLASFGTLLAAALVAAWIPARRAASVDPIAALRAE